MYQESDMNRTFFIDESGNSGDLIRRDKVDFSFANQPRFALSCIEISDQDELSKLVSNLKLKYNVQGDELKAKNIYTSSPEFMLDLFSYISDKRLAFFIELVDKKFFICTTIANHYIIPPYFTGNESDGHDQILRNIASDYMYNNMPEENYKLFFDACFNQTEESLLTAMSSLKNFFLEIKNDPDMQNMHKLVEESIDDYFSIKSLSNNLPDSIKKFIPIPDINNKGYSVWLLPHISSLANIIARVNLFANGRLDSVDFIHDKQTHFDSMLELTKKLLYTREKPKNSPKIITANYQISSEPRLTFNDSKLSPYSLSLQVADILAGFIVRYADDVLFKKKTIDKVYHDAYSTLSNSFNAEKGIGLNMVFPESLLIGNNIQYNYNFIYKDIIDQ
jgi:hypothetical protein